VALRILLSLLVLVLLAAALGLRASRPTSSVDKFSERPSGCGEDAGRWASDLGLERARELTLCLLNERRAREGVPPLRLEPRLQLAAQRYAQEMVDGRFFEHDSPAGTDPQERILMAGYPSHAASSGENLAWATGSEQSPVEVVDGWMHSPGHRENVMRLSFAEIGIGIVFDIPVERSDAPPGATYATSFGGAPLPG
jgi:hypothetical protein